MFHFVLLDHDFPQAHLDLMLERDGVLWTWRLLQEPRLQSIQPAERLPDHRLAYLDYEGPVSNNRGRVIRRDRGIYEVVEENDGLLIVNLKGGQNVGQLTLVRLQNDQWKARFVLEEKSS